MGAAGAFDRIHSPVILIGRDLLRQHHLAHPHGSERKDPPG
jgi:hypothetical protein